MRLSKRTNILTVIVLFPIIFAFLAGCSNAAASKTTDLNLASMDGMPNEVKSAPFVVQQSYRFAAANPSAMKQIPCYCGCDNIGHTSNYSCYISGMDDSGNLTYDTHALGCSLCVDITQDVMRLQKQGKTVMEIKNYIDQTYSQYGPSNMP